MTRIVPQTPPEPDPLPERFEKLDAPTQAYLLNNLAVHLDEVGDEHAVRQLLELARSGFPQLKAERTLDVSLTSRDYRYYFRASLRAGDLRAALDLAPSQGGLTRLFDWLASGVLADLLAYVGPDSRLWQQVQAAVSAIPSPTLRVERLAGMHRPGLQPTMYTWLRREFDNSAADARDSARTDFLTAVATHEHGAIQYILARARSAPPDTRFARAVVANLSGLCEGTQIRMQDAMSQIAALLQGHSGALIAAAEALASVPPEDAAIGLEALETVIPQAEGYTDALATAASIAHGWSLCGNPARARALVAHCFDLVPPVVLNDDDGRRTLSSRSSIEASERLLRAAAPFDELWPNAKSLAKDLASRGTWVIHRAEALAGFVRVLPWIANPRARLRWLRETLKGIREFASSDLDRDDLDTLEIAFGVLAGKKETSPRRFRLKPIEEALFEALRHVDQIVISPTALNPLVDLVKATSEIAADRDANLHEAEEDDASPIAERLLLAASVSRNVGIRLVVAETFLHFMRDDPRALDSLATMLPILLEGLDDGSARMMANGILTSAQNRWCARHPEMEIEFACAVLGAIVGSGQRALFDAVGARLPGWLDISGPEEAETLMTGWAAAHIAVGQLDHGRQLLRGLMPENRSTRLMIASVLLRSGADADAAAVLGADLPTSVNLEEPQALDESVEIVRLLLLAQHDERARERLLSAAFEYRRRAELLDDSLEGQLLTAFSDLEDDAIVTALLRAAERELLQSDEHDAAMAAYWYVALALSSIGENAAARNVWAKLHDWRQQSLRQQTRKQAIEVLAKPDSIAPVEELLGTVKALDEGHDSRPILQTACRMLSRIGTQQRVALLSGLLDIARNSDFKGWATTLLEGICRELMVIEADSAFIRATVAQVLAILSQVKATDRDARPDVLRALISLMSSHSLRGEGQFDEVAYPIARTEQQLWTQALEIGSDPVAAIAPCETVPLRERYLLLNAILAEGARRKSARTVEEVITKLMALAHTEPHSPELQTSLAEALKLAQDITTDLSRADLESRVRRLGTPAPTSALVTWATALKGTALEESAMAALAELGKRLDALAADPGALQSLEGYLRAASPHEEEPLVELYAAISTWAVSMPLVTNEDRREQAFADILRSTSEIHPTLRRSIQTLILERAFGALADSDYAASNLAKALIRLPLDTQTTHTAISLYLRTRSERHDSFEVLLDVLVEGMQYDTHAANPAVIAAFLEHIAEGSAATLKREKTAGVAFETNYEPLRSRLTQLVLNEYERHGIASLSKSELNLLTAMPLEWWIEHSPQITLDDHALRTLNEWIRGFIQRQSDAAWWATILATEWLSRSEPGRVRDFWFELCLLPAWFPQASRDILIRKLQTQ